MSLVKKRAKKRKTDLDVKMCREVKHKNLWDLLSALPQVFWTLYVTIFPLSNWHAGVSCNLSITSSKVLEPRELKKITGWMYLKGGKTQKGWGFMRRTSSERDGAGGGERTHRHSFLKSTEWNISAKHQTSSREKTREWGGTMQVAVGSKL